MTVWRGEQLYECRKVLPILLIQSKGNYTFMRRQAVYVHYCHTQLIDSLTCSCTCNTRCQRRASHCRLLTVCHCNRCMVWSCDFIDGTSNVLFYTEFAIFTSLCLKERSNLQSRKYGNQSQFQLPFLCSSVECWFLLMSYLCLLLAWSFTAVDWRLGFPGRWIACFGRIE